MKKILALMLTALLILTCFAACKGENEGDLDPEAVFTSFETKTLDGDAVNESIFKGKKLTMINIWGTFCGPCIKEMPDLSTLNEKYADKSFQVVGIVCDVQYSNGDIIEEKIDEAKGIVKDTGVEYMSILPYPALNQSILSGSYSIPLTYFVNEKGEIVGESYLGSKSLEDWESIILNLLEE